MTPNTNSMMMVVLFVLFAYKIETGLKYGVAIELWMHRYITKMWGRDNVMILNSKLGEPLSKPKPN